MCPDISDITVDNNPILYSSGNGTSFTMVANTCEAAKKIEIENNLTPFSDLECAPSDALAD